MVSHTSILYGLLLIILAIACFFVGYKFHQLVSVAPTPSVVAAPPVVIHVVAPALPTAIPTSTPTDTSYVIPTVAPIIPVPPLPVVATPIPAQVAPLPTQVPATAMPAPTPITMAPVPNNSAKAQLGHGQFETPTVGMGEGQLQSGTYRYVAPDGSHAVEGSTYPFILYGTSKVIRGCYLAIHMDGPHSTQKLFMAHGQPFEFSFRTTHGKVGLDQNGLGCTGHMQRIGN